MLELTGTIWQRPYKVVGKPNACPFCSFGPLVCNVCGYFYPDCPTCNKRTMKLWSAHPGGNDKQLKFDDVSKAGRILQGKTWDGKDWVQSIRGNFITKRTLDWLLCVHAKPFCVRPARVLVDGMSAEQKRWLKRAQEPIVNGMM